MTDRSPAEITPKMARALFLASGTLGVANLPEIHDALDRGWIAYWRTPQVSMTRRYRITDAGRAALAAATAAA